MTTTRAINPTQAALERVVLLLNKISIANNRANSLYELALNDAAKRPHVDTDYVPVILSENALVEFARLKNELADLTQYYQKQQDSISALMVSSVDSVQESAEVQHAVWHMRQRIDLLARETPTAVPTENVLTTLDGRKVPTVTAAREAAAAIREERLDKETAAKSESRISNGVTYHLSTEQKPSPEAETQAPTIPTEDIQAVLQKRENCLELLMGPNSPLLELFAAGPWLPDGKGFITVGSQGFQWHKGVYPTDKPGATRATLPTGFYGGEERPQCVLLRLETAILIWPFEMDPEHTYVYFVGLSDTDPTNTFQWFPLSGLSASYTRRLVDQIKAILPERPAV